MPRKPRTPQVGQPVSLHRFSRGIDHHSRALQEKVRGANEPDGSGGLITAKATLGVIQP